MIMKSEKVTTMDVGDLDRSDLS